jgi:hypothetical protein
VADTWKHGSGLMPTPLERLNRKIIPEPNTGCWLWLGCLCHDGYPQTRWPVTQKRGYAHRLVYELMVGPIPDSHELDHTCFVRDCVNPDHLRPLTPTENKKYRKVPGVSKEELVRRGRERARENRKDPVRNAHINRLRKDRRNALASQGRNPIH